MRVTCPGTFATTPTDATWTTPGVSLSANTTYWLVLRASSGTFNWAWTSANTGTGVGYTNTWADSDNAGSIWFSSTAFPFLASVTATPVPEPGSLLLAGLAAAAWAGRRAKTRRPTNS